MRSHLRASWPAWPGQGLSKTHDASATTFETMLEVDGCHQQVSKAEDGLTPSPASHHDGNSSHLSLNRDLRTRNLSVIGLCLGWIAAIAALTAGIYMLVTPNVMVPEYLLGKLLMIGPEAFRWSKPTRYLYGRRVYKVSEAGMVALPLALQLVITVLCGCLGSIHATTLRWALWREGRLCHANTLRLFTSSRRNGPNKWPANAVAALGLLLTYGGASVMTFPVSVIAIRNGSKYDYNLDNLADRSGIDFNGWGLVGLGAGLLLQAVISTWALLDSAYVGTWNANPLATARACRVLQDTGRGPLPLPLPLSSPQASTPLLPASRQPSALTLYPTLRTLANAIWAVSLLTVALLLAIAIRASLPGASRDTRKPTTSVYFVEHYIGHADAWHVWQFFGTVRALYNWDPFAQRTEWVGLLVQCAALAPVTAGLHVAESIIALRRDERIWRGAATEGVDPEGSVLVPRGVGWLMVGYQCVVPWVFGFAIACNGSMHFATLPALVVAVMFLALGGVVEWLIRARPRGTQPATYGDVRVLMALVDDWDHKKIFWGDKGGVGFGVRRAGTAGRRLADLVPGVPYVGLKRGLEDS